MRRHPLRWFFLIAFAFSWAFWLPAAAAALGWIDPVPALTLHFLGGLGPMVSAIVVTASSAGPEAVRELAARARSGGAWVAVAVLLPVAVFGLSALIVSEVYRAPLNWRALGTSAEAPTLARPAFWLATLVCYGYGEEVGWRGFALPRLQARSTALHAAILLTLPWAAWHLPLFAFSPGLASLPAPAIAGWALSLALGSILLTWLFNASGGSVAAVAAFHATLDILITPAVSPHLPSVMGAVLTVGAVLVIPLAGQRHLARRAA
jgi:membrane protease YdiL (CAAX protease family)